MESNAWRAKLHQLCDRLGVSQAKPNAFLTKAELKRKRNMGAENTLFTALSPQ